MELGKSALQLGTSQILRIPESSRKLEEATRKPAMTEYLQRIRQVLRSQMNGRNIVQPINICVLPAIRYATGIINWPRDKKALQEETKAS